MGSRPDDSDRAMHMLGMGIFALSGGFVGFVFGFALGFVLGHR